MTAATRRRRGRPALEESDARVRVHLSLPARLYDVIYQRAQARRESVPAQVRRVLQVNFRHTK